MGTIDKIKAHGEALIDKIKSGEILTKDEHAVLKIYNSLYAKRAGNSGKRNGSSLIQKVK